MTAIVIATGARSVFGKSAQLMREPKIQTKLQNFIFKIAITITVSSLILCVILIIVKVSLSCLLSFPPFKAFLGHHHHYPRCKDHPKCSRVARFRNSHFYGSRYHHQSCFGISRVSQRWNYHCSSQCHRTVGWNGHCSL